MDPSKEGFDPRRPQSWNRYSYTRGNPLKYVDPDGAVIACPQSGCPAPPDTILGKALHQGAILPMAAPLELGPEVAGPVARALARVPFLRRVGTFFARVFGPGEQVQALLGAVSRSALAAAAEAGGPAQVVLTSLTEAPAAGRALSVATGEGAEALANAARSGGALFRAKIPVALLQKLKDVALAIETTTRIGDKTAAEIRFLPAASEFIAKYFVRLPE